MSWRTVHGDPTTVLAIVELDEGPWLYTLLTESPRVDAAGPLRVSFQRREHGKRYPVFCLCGDVGGALQSDISFRSAELLTSRESRSCAVDTTHAAICAREVKTHFW